MTLDEIIIGRKVTLQEVLDARERRVMRQKKLLGLAPCLISYTLNIPGEVKQYPVAKSFFKRGLCRLKRALERAKFDVVHEESFAENAGNEAFLCVNADPLKVKRIACALEESSVSSRLYDMDVLNSKGEKLSRTDIGLEGRKCIVCGDDVSICAPRRKHSAEELAHAAASMMWNCLTGKFADLTAACAQRALLYEVCTTPKPGLVDRANSGSHNDMDIFTFADSASSLAPYFRSCAAFGIENSHLAPQKLLFLLRLPGMEAEDAMFSATGGVNVHKGAIFSFGLFCAAAGAFWVEGKKLIAEDLGDFVSEMSGRLEEDFKAPCSSNGEKIHAKTGISGARGEAQKGFPSAVKVGLPMFRSLVEKGNSINDSAAATLLHLITEIDDTNMIKRGGLEQFRLEQQRIRQLTANNPVVDLKTLSELDKHYISKNLSPGGSADMLALTLLLYFLEKLSVPSEALIKGADA